VGLDRRQGRYPRFIITRAGTTNTGAVDELEALAELGAAESLWLHVDGAFGAPAALCRAGGSAPAGLERADSLVLDPHKWLFLPYHIGCVSCADRGP
jgi:aromatic-L-amino-acid/L-tryptophan decarboxylase